MTNGLLRFVGRDDEMIKIGRQPDQPAIEIEEAVVLAGGEAAEAVAFGVAGCAAGAGDRRGASQRRCRATSMICSEPAAHVSFRISCSRPRYLTGGTNSRATPMASSTGPRSRAEGPGMVVGTGPGTGLMEPMGALPPEFCAPVGRADDRRAVRGGLGRPGRRTTPLYVYDFSIVAARLEARSAQGNAQGPGRALCDQGQSAIRTCWRRSRLWSMASMSPRAGELGHGS